MTKLGIFLIWSRCLIYSGEPVAGICVKWNTESEYFKTAKTACARVVTHIDNEILAFRLSVDNEGKLISRPIELVCDKSK